MIVANAVGIVGAAPAFAMCPSDSGWAVTGKTDFWFLTSAYSIWETGPGWIQYSESKTATRSTVQSTSITASIDYVIGSAEAKYGVTWSSSTSLTQVWSYSIWVPSGQTARAGIYKRASRFNVQHYTDYSNCTTSWGPIYYQYSPYASNNNSYYCIGKDPKPGTAYVYTSGCGH